MGNDGAPARRAPGGLRRDLTEGRRALPLTVGQLRATLTTMRDEHRSNRPPLALVDLTLRSYILLRTVEEQIFADVVAALGGAEAFRVRERLADAVGEQLRRLEPEGTGSRRIPELKVATWPLA